MKKLISLIMILICVVSLNAQKPFTNYSIEAMNETCDIQISIEKGLSTLWIDGISSDPSVKLVGIEVKEGQLNDFITNLKESQIKYIQWITKAKENNVTDVSKEIELSSTSPKFIAYFNYGKWQFDFNVKFSYNFKVIKSGEKVEYLLILRTGELQSSSNQFMTCKNMSIVFSNPKELTNFIDKISIEKITEYKNKPQPEELFK